MDNTKVSSHSDITQDAKHCCSVQSALHIHGIHNHGSTNHKPKIFGEKLHLYYTYTVLSFCHYSLIIHYNSYLCGLYLTLVTSYLDLILSIWEGVHMFHVRDLNIHRFWYPKEVLGAISLDTEWWLFYMKGS